MKYNIYIYEDLLKAYGFDPSNFDKAAIENFADGRMDEIFDEEAAAQNKEYEDMAYLYEFAYKYEAYVLQEGADYRAMVFEANRRAYNPLYHGPIA